MINHLFKLIWSRKSRNFLIMLQLFVSFLALFVFIGLNIKKFTNYFRPLNYSYENVWAINFSFNGVKDDQAKSYLEKIELKLRRLKEIELISASFVIPFYNWPDKTTLFFNKQEYIARKFEVDENFQKLLNVELVKGNWFKRQNLVTNIIPVIITESLAGEIGENPLGKEVRIGQQKGTVMGICKDFRESISSDDEPCFFIPITEGKLSSSLLLKSSHAQDLIYFDGLMRKEILSVADQNITINQAGPLTLFKKYKHKTDYLQMTFAFIIFAFLILNVFLGISGVITYNISLRTGEIGLRSAVGAHSYSIQKQFIGESMMLTTISIIPGVLVAIQFMVTHYFYPYIDFYTGTISILLSALFLYLLMFACAFYPSLRASKLQPSQALHED
jgi:putative ABC transport system permease protein